MLYYKIPNSCLGTESDMMDDNMKRFAKTWPNPEILQQPVAKGQGFAYISCVWIGNFRGKAWL